MQDRSNFTKKKKKKVLLDSTEFLPQSDIQDNITK